MNTELHERLKKIDEVKPDDYDQDIVFQGINLHVKAGVFNPNKGKSAKKMSKAINLFPPSLDSRILEIGTGCGVLSSLLWMKGCRFILATDIDTNACVNATDNFQSKGFDIEVVQSNLFDQINYNFDYIIFNAPASHPSRINYESGKTSLWDPKGDLKERFVNDLKQFKPKGKMTAIFMYSKYIDYDPLENINFEGFDTSFLLVEKDSISETGVILLSRD